MTGFLETPRFPDELAHWAEGGANFNTSIVSLLSGFEQRNINWAFSRGIWNITEQALVLPANERLLVQFFNIVLGKAYGFRFKDFRDYQDWGGGVFTPVSTAPTILFQMAKSYNVGSGLSANVRPIKKPIVAPSGGQAFVMYYNGSPISSGSGAGQYTLDATTGLVTMGAGSDTDYTKYTWIGEFDVPCRFDTDSIAVWREPQGGFMEWKTIPIVEIRV